MLMLVSANTPLDDVPENEREEVAPSQIRVGDVIYDPKRKLWITVAHIQQMFGGQRSTRPPWHVDITEEEWVFYYFANHDWAHGAGFVDHRLVTRQRLEE